MHDSSFNNMRKCFDKYIKGEYLNSQQNITILDIGSMDVNGSYRPIFNNQKIKYIGVDLSEGKNVDLVLSDPYYLPFTDNSIDIVISGQMLEHCEFFWKLFAEMVRILKIGGYIFLIAPSSGPIHRYPVDCYRFYPDSYRALAKYANCQLLEVWHDLEGQWKDLVGIFRKHPISITTEYETLLAKVEFEKEKSKQNKIVSFPKRLNIGSGKTFKYNFLNVDINNYWKPDIVFDLNLPFPSSENQKFQTVRFGEIILQPNSFDEIVAHDVLEHIRNLTICMESCLNLLKVGGIFEILVPYDLSCGAWQDPTHVRAFNEKSWLYYTDWFWYLGWKGARFEISKLEYGLSDLGKKLQKDGVLFENILHTPRAVDNMLVFLKKVTLNEKDKMVLNHYYPPHPKAIPETIWIVNMPNNPHFPLSELAIALQSGFSELGYNVDIVDNIQKVRGKTLVLGCGRIPKIGLTTLPKNLILFNLDQIHQDSPWLTEDYLMLLKTYPVWDYSYANIEALQKLGISNITYCGIGYVPKLSRIFSAKEDIDVLFYGALNPRRQKILDKLQSTGFNVVRLSQVYGSERDNYIARAKIVLNIHFYESKIFEIVRVSYLLSNKKCVISEKGHDDELEKPFQEGVCFCNYEELVDKCSHYLKNNTDRIKLAEKGFKCISMYPQAEFLRQALKLEKMPDSNKLILKILNFEMFVPESNTDGIFISLRSKGVWEEQITQAIISNLAKYRIDTFIDIGANIGYYTLLAKSKGVKKCYSFEPHDINFGLLKQNVNLNKYTDCYLHNIGLGKDSGVFEFNYRDAKSGHGTFFSTIKKQQNLDKILKKEVKKLDDINIVGNNIGVKIDVEGFELDVLEGMINLLESKKIKFMIIEITPKFYGKEIEKEIINILRKYFTNLVILEENKPLKEETLTIEQYNILCISSEKVAVKREEQFDKHKSIFIQIPRTASVPIAKSLFGNLESGFTKIREYQKIYNETEFKDYFKFVFVRNPWDRLISTYHFLSADNIGEKDKQWAENNLSKYQNFDSFIKGWLNRENIYTYYHFIPQFEFVCIEGLEPAVDFIGYFENLEEDFKFVADKLGIQVNKYDSDKIAEIFVNENRDYAKYYSDETAKIVADVYREDIEIFGYDFE